MLSLSERSNRLSIAILVLWISSCFAACSDKGFDQVPEVDQKRFMGTWYEVAALPTSFNKGCSCSKMDLQADDGDGYVKMIYSCIKKEKQGAVLAKIYSADNGSFSRWRLQYFWPFRNTLYVIALDSSYTHAMVAGPDRDFLQILSRSSLPDQTVTSDYISKAGSLGFNTDALVFPEQKCN
jgi:apolipoprotein D and lipocalin family protein